MVKFRNTFLYLIHNAEIFKNLCINALFSNYRSKEMRNFQRLLSAFGLDEDVDRLSNMSIPQISGN